MSRSYRKHAFDSYVCYSRRSMKEWRSGENRKLRRRSKQLIDSCIDFDNLILPVLNNFDTLWGSPQDGRKHYIKTPYLNDCEVRAYRDITELGYDLDRLRRWHGFNGEHFRYCRCYNNKRSYYWKTKIK